MSQYPKLRLLDPKDLIAKLDLEADDPSVGIVVAAQSADALVEGLEASGADRHLAKSILHMLPAREAVWTACLFARVDEVSLDAAPSRAHRAAEVWVRDQDEPTRYKAFEFAEEEELATTGAWAGMAAFFSGPSLAPIDAQTPVPPPPGHGAVAAAAAHSILLARAPLDKALPGQVAALARRVAEGGNGVDLVEEITAAGQPTHRSG